MKYICPLSSIEVETNYFSNLSTSSRELLHPIFYLPQKTLLAQTANFAKGNFSDTETYLLFLALLRSSKLIHFRSSAFPSDDTISTIYNSYEKLIKILIRISTVPEVEKIFPVISINPDTKDLTHAPVWISLWEDSYKKWTEGYKFSSNFKELDIRERALERMIRNPHNKPTDYISQVASWAAMAGAFPTFNLEHPKTKKTITLADYWVELIKNSVHPLKVWDIPEKDLKELREHCWEKIEPGTLFSKALFSAIEQAVESQKNWKGLGDINVATNFKILSQSESSATVEVKNLTAIAAAAPDKEPKREDYIKNIDYLRAKLAWQQAAKSN